MTSSFTLGVDLDGVVAYHTRGFRDFLAHIRVVVPETFSLERSWDFAVCLGGGVEIPAGRVSLLAEGLYSIGLRNIAVDVPGGNVTDVKTRTFLANFGIRF